MNYIRRIGGILAWVSVAAGTVGCGEDMPIHQEYSGAWNTSFNLEISKALAQHGARDCGEYVFKESKERSGNYLVYCSADADQWSAYKVWLPLGEAEGPFRPHAKIPPPQ